MFRIRELQQACLDLSNRGLVNAAKWAAELAANLTKGFAASATESSSDTPFKLMSVPSVTSKIQCFSSILDFLFSRLFAGSQCHACKVFL
jgi:hypothetical protein